MNVASFNQGWAFACLAEADRPSGDGDGELVTLPHMAVELPYDYFDEASYQRAFSYRKKLDWVDAFEGKVVGLVFDGVMADAEVLLNGQPAVAHADGYTPFEVDLTEALGPNGVQIELRLSGAENPEIPPFGGQIDYLTYAGIYRDVWLTVRDPVSIGAVRVETRNVLSRDRSVLVECRCRSRDDRLPAATWRAEILDPLGHAVAEVSAPLERLRQTVELTGLPETALWSPAAPTLYTLRLTLEHEGGSDRRDIPFGFREARFEPNGFFLNGERVKLIGLNRHQSFPYTGYAQGRASQERDAELLRYELGCNIARTSHYPQSPWFLDHCDRIGLMVLEEIPGWQHIGGGTWKDRAVENVRAMIERDCNHPSIVLWGVRINESPDDGEFYARTNALARELDPTRQTGGTRKHTESELLEDVYTFNDFIMGEFELPGSNRARTALRDQREATGREHDVPYLVTEYNGHMYPTKVFDQEQRQVEHVTRHLEVLDAAHGDDRIAGCIGWCMADYNTHKDFGSGDRVCHHGVLTMFREPKFAAFAYASQMDPADRIVMQPVTFWARGERNIGGVLPLMVLSNCEQVLMRLPGGTEVALQPDRARFAHLPHPPMMLRAEDLPEGDLGRWGNAWSDVTFVGLVAGKEVARMTMLAAPVADRLEVAPDRTTLEATHGEVRVAVRALDQAGNRLPFVDAPITVSVEGAAERVGPASPALRGGATAFWVRPTGVAGSVRIDVSSPRFPTTSVELEVRRSG